MPPAVCCGASALLLRGAVARALEELNARHHRITRERVHAEDQRPIDETVDQHLMLLGIDIGHAVMVALEMQRARRDDAFERLERRARAAGARRARCRTDGSLHAGFVRRALAVGAQRHAGRLHPRGHVRRRGTRGHERAVRRRPRRPSRTSGDAAGRCRPPARASRVHSASSSNGPLALSVSARTESTARVPFP